MDAYRNAQQALEDWLGFLRRLALTELGKPLPGGPAPAEGFFALRRRAQGAEVPLPLSALAENLRLCDFSVFCIMVAAAGGFDAGFGELWAGLCGDRRPTLGVAARLFGHIGPVESEALAEVLDPLGPCRLAFALEGEMPHYGRRLRPAPALHAVLHGGIAPLAGLEGLGWHLPGEAAPRHYNEALAGQMVAFLQAAEAEGRACTLLVSGEPGCGRRRTLREAARRLGLPLALVEYDALAALTPARLEEAGGEILLWAAALGGRVAVTGLTRGLAENHGMAAFITRCRRVLSSLLLTAEGSAPGWLPLGGELVEFAFAPDDLLARRRAWQEAAAGYRLEPGLDTGQFANKLRYSAGQVRRILRRAQLHALGRQAEAIAAGDIWAAVHLHNAGQPEGRSLSRVECVFTWDDLVLPAEQLGQMHAACNRILHAHTVNDEWGFGKKLPYGRGVSVLLYGPPGTGKTMSAQVMARELGLELYKVDLSQLVSKYIGETEKNVAEIFSFARRCNCVLLFDEADSLFSRRTEVKDANDRHANTETAFLLQKIEEHSGVSILSTNLLGNMDKAFLRRFTYVVGIPMPDAALRLTIWEKAFPPGAPLAAGVEFGGLAANLELSASAIKSAALEAGYLAAAEGGEIGFAHVARAVRAELQKQGTRLSEAEIALLRG